MSYPFKLVGGHPALDFLNSVHDWTVAERNDYLAQFDDAIAFGEAVGLLTRSEAARLRDVGSGPELTRLRALRTLLAQVFRARASAKLPSPKALQELSNCLIESARSTRLRPAARLPMRREIALEVAGAATLRLRIADAALNLLSSDAGARVKSCPSCGWFFLDLSKNQSRRWCSMDACGASAKARRYYRRVKGRARS